MTASSDEIKEQVRGWFETQVNHDMIFEAIKGIQDKNYIFFPSLEYSAPRYTDFNFLVFYLSRWKVVCWGGFARNRYLSQQSADVKCVRAFFFSVQKK